VASICGISEEVIGFKKRSVLAFEEKTPNLSGKPYTRDPIYMILSCATASSTGARRKREDF